MARYTALILALFLFPGLAEAATFSAARTLLLSEPLTGNVYVAGQDVRATVVLPADLLAAGGTVTVLAPVGGDLLAVGGTLDIQGPIAGDARLAGGQVQISSEAKGDLVVLGGVVRIAGKVREARITGATVELIGGAAGPVTVYGTSVVLSGEFAGDVTVTASERLTLGERTAIRGTLRYNAPQQASIPESATVGVVEYTGSSFFLPTAEEAKRFALAGLGVLFMVKLVSSLVVAGLVAGLFPAFSQAVADRALSRSVGTFALLALLGFAVLAATPVLLFLLLASFVGIGVALLIGAAYFLFILLSYVYAAVIAGAVLMRALRKRPTFVWRDAVLGMLVLFLVGAIPGIGFLAVLVLSSAAAGALIALFYGFAFPKSALDED